jgi:DNA-binding NarL/FixJ family response regulator
MYPAIQYADYVRRAGGQGFVSKDADSQTLIDALRRVASGRSAFLHPALVMIHLPVCPLARPRCLPAC